ncbi:hypothetical protein MVEG_07026 [Podila verticillata NRRL 6337]|nr:hypothetical protein MVEG_07026 [Podila verticillata NRRL 6337]
MESNYHPLNVPEILFMLSKYFSAKEAVKPSQVCRTWNKVFNNVVWRECTIDRNAMFSVDTLHRNAHHIRSLAYNVGASIEAFPAPCKQLRKITLDNSQALIGFPEQKQASFLIEKNPNLEDLIIRFDRSKSHSELIWTRVKGASHLRSLEVRDACFDKKAIGAFWKACRNIKWLSLQRIIRHNGEGDFFKRSEASYPNLTHVALNLSQRYLVLSQLELINRCPSLTTLSMKTNDSTTMVPLDGMRVSVGQGNMSRLESLAIDANYDEQELARCLAVLPLLKEFKMGRGVFIKSTFLQLERHFKTLDRLDMYDTGFSSEMVQQVMESCPCLTRLSAQWLEATTVLAGRPWQCLDLRMLKVGFCLASTDQSRGVFQHLGQLTKLTLLKIGVKHRRFITDRLLDFRVESGMDELLHLKDLQVLDIEPAKPSWSDSDPADREWLRENMRGVKIVV